MNLSEKDGIFVRLTPINKSWIRMKPEFVSDDVAMGVILFDQAMQRLKPATPKEKAILGAFMITKLRDALKTDLKPSMNPLVEFLERQHELSGCTETDCVTKTIIKALKEKS